MIIGSTPNWEGDVELVPLYLIGGGLVLGSFILLGRAFVDTIRTSGHKRWIFAGLGVLVLAVVVLTYLGVNLPKEE